MWKIAASIVIVLPLAGGPPTLEEALAWLKKVDSNFKQPRFDKLSVEALKSLEEIRLGGHRASDGKHVALNAADFKYLTALPALKKANLDEIDGLTDEALVHIGKIATLTELQLGDAWITSAGVKHLEKLKDLTRLQIGWTRDVNDAALPSLLKLAKLEFLGLGGTKVTDAGLPLLARLANLKELHLQDTAVTNAGLKSLASVKSLATVNFGKKHKVTPEGIAQFQKLRPDCKVLTN